MLRLFWLAVLALALLAGPVLAAGARVALVIGNAGYAKVGQLANPVNDATDLAAALERIGFTVTLATDLDFVGMHRALQAFGRQAEGADMAMVYFAGHGVEIDKQNFLIPTDATLDSDRQVVLETISLDLVTEAVSGAKSLRMVVLDACRNNPFLERMVRSVASRSIGRGLGAFEPGGGTLVAYAAKGGTVASDGRGRNSPFMAGLLAHIEEPGLDISLMFRKVRDDVLKATDNGQEPFVYGSLPGEEIHLVPAVVAEVAPTPVPEAMPELGSEQEEFAWSLVKDSGDASKLQQYLFAYPQGVHVPEAIALIKALQAPPEAQVAVVEPERTVPETVVEPLAPVVPELQGPELVAAVQRELGRLGCNPGTADGVWGRRSREAVSAFASATNRMVSPVATSQLLAELQKLDGTICRPAPEPVQQVKVEERRETPAAPNDCAIVSIRATDRDPAGDVWDWAINGNPEPDILLSELTTGLQASCPDSFTCSLRVSPVKNGTVQIKAMDHDDITFNQLIGQGQCKVGSTCRFSNGTVTVKAC